MNRWFIAAIFLLLCGAWNVLCAQDSVLTPDTSVRTRHDSARVDSSRPIVTGAFTSFGYWIFENMRNTGLYWAYKLRPVTRALAKICHNLLHSPDENSMIRVPLSKRK
ncbi:hypothetical protein EHM69_12560 [candidate division KSB1 bacterium]|nr:MAG: hypothetical protein EHM69_12560 [candidate division KSB1 bacterium]